MKAANRDSAPGPQQDPALPTTSEKLHTLAAEIEKRRQEVVDLDRCSVDLATGDAEKSIEYDGRARGVEKLISRMLTEYAELRKVARAEKVEARCREIDVVIAREERSLDTHLSGLLVAAEVFAKAGRELEALQPAVTTENTPWPFLGKTLIRKLATEHFAEKLAEDAIAYARTSYLGSLGGAHGALRREAEGNLSRVDTRQEVFNVVMSLASKLPPFNPGRMYLISPPPAGPSGRGRDTARNGGCCMTTNITPEDRRLALEHEELDLQARRAKLEGEAVTAEEAARSKAREQLASELALKKVAIREAAQALRDAIPALASAWNRVHALPAGPRVLNQIFGASCPELPGVKTYSLAGTHINHTARPFDESGDTALSEIIADLELEQVAHAEEICAAQLAELGVHNG